MKRMTIPQLKSLVVGAGTIECAYRWLDCLNFGRGELYSIDTPEGEELRFVQIQYDNTHPIKVSGGAKVPVMVIGRQWRVSVGDVLKLALYDVEVCNA